MDDIKRACSREKSRLSYLRRREKALAYSRIQNSHPHRPGTRMPAEILAMVRLQTLIDDGDPGVPLDLQLAAIKIGNEFEWLGRGWLHPDCLVTLSKAWAQNWRDLPHIRENTLKFADKIG